MKNKNEIKLLLTLVIIAISFFLIINSIPISDKNIYTYDAYQNTDYKVYLIKNDFYTEDYLEKNKVYLKNLTKYIEVNFDYNYNASLEENLSCKYDIIATLYIEHSNTNQVILEKQYTIIENKELKQYNKKIDFNEKINIDYQKYNNEVAKFKEQFNVPVTAYLVLNFNAKTGIENQVETQQISNSKVTINLDQQAYEIKVKESDEQENTILETQNTNSSINYTLLIAGIILGTISTAYLLYQIWKYQIKESKKVEVQVGKILKKYKNLIIELERKPKIEMKNIIDVKDFEELITIEEEIREPILYYKYKEKNIFLIIDNSIIYRKEIFTNFID